MKIISIDFKSEKKFDTAVEILKEMTINDFFYISYNSNTIKRSIDIYIGGEITMIYAYCLDDGITLSIHTDISYYDQEEQKVKRIDENIRIIGIISYIIT